MCTKTGKYFGYLVNFNVAHDCTWEDCKIIIKEYLKLLNRLYNITWFTRLCKYNLFNKTVECQQNASQKGKI